MKNIREIKGPRWVATQVFNSQIDLVCESVEENEKRAKKFQEPLPIPKFNVAQMVELTKKLTCEAFEERRREMGDDWFGNAQEWEYEAMRTLRDDLKVYAARTGDDDLMWQIQVLWPETRPPRDLTPEELEKLVELQGKTDEIMENLTDTVRDALEELWSITQAEYETVKETNAGRLLFNQVGWYVNFLQRYIDVFWAFKRGSTTTLPEIIEQEMKRAKPKRWVN